MAFGPPGNQATPNGDDSEKPTHTKPHRRRAHCRAGTIDRTREGLILRRAQPDAATVAPLKAAAKEALAWLMNKAATDVTPWWPDSQWCVPSPPITMPTEFKWEVPNYFDVDSRGIALSQYFCPTAKLGTGSFYFGSFHDHGGQPLGARIRR